MIENNDISLLEMEAVQMIQSILGLLNGHQRVDFYETMRTYIHNIVKHHKCGAPRLLLVSNTNLADAAVPAKEVIQVLARNLVVEILDKEDPVGPWRQLGLQRVQNMSEIAEEKEELRAYCWSCERHVGGIGESCCRTANATAGEPVIDYPIWKVS